LWAADHIDAAGQVNVQAVGMLNDVAQIVEPTECLVARGGPRRAAARRALHSVSGHGQSADERGVFGRGAAEVEHGTQPLIVAREKCLRIEPQS